MITHDTLAFSAASKIVDEINHGSQDWSHIFGASAHATTSRAWPMPDFVVVDGGTGDTLAAEFKPPDQSKREYLTGLGQAAAYSRDFSYVALIIPEIADDGYRIAEHIDEVLQQAVLQSLPLALLTYDPTSSNDVAETLRVLRRLQSRVVPPAHRARLDNSFWAKWREVSPNEIGLFLTLLYDESVRPTSDPATTKLRDRAFGRFLDEVSAGRVTNSWAGTVRHITRSPKNDLGWRKNYTNFLSHLGWIEPDGELTDVGLNAIQVLHRYGATSRVCIDVLTRALLGPGKHLVLINEIEQFQSRRVTVTGAFQDEAGWLNEIEQHLQNQGLIKRNPQRHEVNVRNSPRQFLKGEKQLWKKLGLIIPKGSGSRVYHRRKGFFFDWNRITTLLSADH